MVFGTVLHQLTVTAAATSIGNVKCHYIKQNWSHLSPVGQIQVLMFPTSAYKHLVSLTQHHYTYTREITVINKRIVTPK